MLTPYQRQGFSLARGFVVLVMPVIHTVLLYSLPAVKQGPVGFVLGFLAETSGAPLFMLLMGLFMALGREKTTGYILKRMLILLFAGYLLNVLKLLLPYYWGWIPQQFLKDNGVTDRVPMHLFFTGDILQFAAIAYACCAFLKKLTSNIAGYTIVFLVVLLLMPLTWTLNDAGLFTIPLALVNGKPPYTFFPLFPWLLYPLAGLLTGALLLKVKTMRFNRLLGVLTLIFMLTGYLLSLTEPAEWQAEFYRLGRGATLFHIGLALGWVLLFVGLAEKVPGNYLFRLLQWLSDHIMPAYILQWIVIFWCFPLFGYNHLETVPSLLALCVTTSVSFLVLAAVLKGIKNIKAIRHGGA
ncbi:heparan-alpha-glucosaminide N-acetyltransferase domain-containing protein [Niabella pedocola]|uniref:Heparan-alpha-glucosaminide N-acetyltransferase domain-containing protein n=1 Tax=Niabella pedocola TaxID=1752077 RepID=A0ABS8PXX1_9BACT|nr:acyltransferase family protein [Niabella pedocola]MCD2425911.1 heparan-alpha-glucosaminide N-acetyltransferase domain-containing protein [Niabella pedocola]